jgi:hypothetical protein
MLKILVHPCASCTVSASMLHGSPDSNFPGTVCSLLQVNHEDIVKLLPEVHDILLCNSSVNAPCTILRVIAAR